MNPTDHSLHRMTIEHLVFYGAVVAAAYLIIRSVTNARKTADPWGADVEMQIEDPQTPPLCHRCLTPQEHNAWFCPACGTAVGPYNNYMPFVYIFSQGEVLRAGVTDHIRPSWNVIGGFILYSLGCYSIFAPIYWYFLFRHLNEQRKPDEAGAIAP